MIQSLFQYIKPHITESGKIDNLKLLLKSTLAWASFEDIFIEFGDDKGSKITTFILFAFCHDSSYFITADNYADTKNGVAELCGLSVEEDFEIISLKNSFVIRAVNFVSSEVKSWKFRKLIALREAAANLEKIAMEKPDAKSKNAAKNIRDASIFSIELSMKADDLETQIYQQTKSKERLKEEVNISIDNLSFEKILKSINAK